MILKGLHIIGEPDKRNIHIERGIIASVDNEEGFPGLARICFDNAIAFPGLINSHDHLEFNLFPPLGNRIYKNYGEWSDDINQNNLEAINAVLNIPRSLRIQWGLYKNLLNGVTTVVDHGKKAKTTGKLVTVFNDCHSLHSLQYEKNWKRMLNNPLAKCKPFVIHVGEGTDEGSAKEIDQLVKGNLFKRELIAVHGVGMSAGQAGNFKALVWCPASNYFLLGATADVEKLKKETNILFGTDSTLSAGWNIWEHLRMAREQKGLDDRELFDAVTSGAADVWNLYDRGRVKHGYDADIIVARAKDASFSSFYSLNPEDILMTILRGEITLFDDSLLDQLKDIKLKNYSKIQTGRSIKFVKGDLPALIQEAREYYPGLGFPVSIPL